MKYINTNEMKKYRILVKVPPVFSMIFYSRVKCKTINIKLFRFFRWDDE